MSNDQLKPNLAENGSATAGRRSISLVGATASGKSAVGLDLAGRLGAEIIALDSMTLYRGMDIGTAKPSTEDRQAVPHHLLDILDPWDTSSVAEYRGWALRAVDEIAARGRRALFVGGTALYLKAMLRGLCDAPPADPMARANLEAEADRLGNAALHDRLARLDPTTARRLHPNDRRRVIRALEVIAATGRPFSEQQVEHAQAAAGAIVFALDRPRPALNDRIDRRVVQMFADGLVDEARALLGLPRPPSLTAAQGVGYREAFDLIAGRIDRAEAIARTQLRTRQFAKRQATWFRNLAEVRAWPVADDEDAKVTADRLAAAIDRLES